MVRKRFLSLIYTMRGESTRIISARPATPARLDDMSEGKTVYFVLDPKNPRMMSDEARARIDALPDEEITAAALSDPENPPLTDEEFEKIYAMRQLRRAREKSRLSQPRFADAFRISLGRLRDLEQGRTRPDSAMLAYLTVIEREPDAVKRALAAA